jgi:hypothetical protein
VTSGEIARTRASGDGLARLGLDDCAGPSPKVLATDIRLICKAMFYPVSIAAIDTSVLITGAPASPFVRMDEARRRQADWAHQQSGELVSRFQWFFFSGFQVSGNWKPGNPETVSCFEAQLWRFS